MLIGISGAPVPYGLSAIWANQSSSSSANSKGSGRGRSSIRNGCGAIRVSRRRVRILIYARRLILRQCIECSNR